MCIMLTWGSCKIFQVYKRNGQEDADIQKAVDRANARVQALNAQVQGGGVPMQQQQPAFYGQQQ